MIPLMIFIARLPKLFSQPFCCLSDDARQYSGTKLYRKKVKVNYFRSPSAIPPQSADLIR